MDDREKRNLLLVKASRRAIAQYIVLLAVGVSPIVALVAALAIGLLEMA